MEKMRGSKDKGWRPLVRTIIFVLVFICLFFYLSSVFSLKDDSQGGEIWNSFYREKPNTLDGVYIGSSSVYAFYMPTRAYEDRGICISNLATASQPVSLIKYVIQESLRTQKDTKVILIDLRNFTRPVAGLKEMDIRYVTDSLRSPDIRYKAIKAALAYYKAMGAKIDYKEEHYLLSYIKFHNRWEDDISLEDWLPTGRHNDFKGYAIDEDAYNTLHMYTPYTVYGEKDLEKAQWKVLKELVAYCKTLKQKVIFVSSPYYTTKDSKLMISNTVYNYVESQGFEVWNFNQEPLKSELNMDYWTDYYQRNHTNVKGAQKYTDFLADMIDDELKLPDHRGMKGYESWDVAARDLKKELSIKGLGHDRDKTDDK